MSDFPDLTPCPSMSMIKAVTADEFDVTVLDLESARRSRSVARPRQVAMYVARHMTRMSLPAIGHHMGHRDHTTVSHGVDKIRQVMDGDPGFAARVHLLMDALARVRVEAVPA